MAELQNEGGRTSPTVAVWWITSLSTHISDQSLWCTPAFILQFSHWIVRFTRLRFSINYGSSALRPITGRRLYTPRPPPLTATLTSNKRSYSHTAGKELPVVSLHIHDNSVIIKCTCRRRSICQKSSGGHFVHRADSGGEVLGRGNEPLPTS